MIPTEFEARRFQISVKQRLVHVVTGCTATATASSVQARCIRAGMIRLRCKTPLQSACAEQGSSKGFMRRGKTTIIVTPGLTRDLQALTLPANSTTAIVWRIVFHLPRKSCTAQAQAQSPHAIISSARGALQHRERLPQHRGHGRALGGGRRADVQTRDLRVLACRCPTSLTRRRGPAMQSVDIVQRCNNR